MIVSTSIVTQYRCDDCGDTATLVRSDGELVQLPREWMSRSASPRTLHRCRGCIAAIKDAEAEALAKRREHMIELQDGM